MERVFLPRQVVNKILQQAESTPQLEICGLIAARDGYPTRCFAVPNVAKDPSHLFAMEPRRQIDVFRKMRERGEELFAIYHSHPGGSAVPSQTDLQQVGYPEALYLIIGTGDRGMPEIRGWRLSGGEIVEVELEI
jgi:proteasome lid subunit RPN8/RPN11